MSISIARRKFVAALSGAVAWPLTARAQQADRMRRIGVLEGLAADNPDAQAPRATSPQDKYAAELVALATRTVPIVFTIVPDPVSAGFVDSLSQPGGNATGIMMFEYCLCGKWLELLKEIAPGVTRAAVLRDLTNAVTSSPFPITDKTSLLGWNIGA
jgi:putative ABC transport system substrate-binding protein